MNNYIVGVVVCIPVFSESRQCTSVKISKGIRGFRTSHSEDGITPHGCVRGVEGIVIGEARPNILSEGHPEATIDLSHVGQTAITIHLQTGNHGTDEIDAQLVPFGDVACFVSVLVTCGTTACDTRVMFLNRCLVASALEHSCVYGTAVTEGADICVSACYSCDNGLKTGTTLIETPDADESVECSDVVFMSAGENSAKIASRFVFYEPAVVDSFVMYGPVSVVVVFVCYKAAVHDRGAKCGTSEGSACVGRDSIAALRDMFVQQASDTNFDGAPPLNGFGDFDVAAEIHEQAQQSTGKALAPGTRSGYQTTSPVRGVQTEKSKPGYCGGNQLATNSVSCCAETIVQNYGPGSSPFSSGKSTLESLGGEIEYVVDGDSCVRACCGAVLAATNECPGCTCSIYANSNDGIVEGTQSSDVLRPLAQHYFEVLFGFIDVYHSPIVPM